MASGNTVISSGFGNWLPATSVGRSGSAHPPPGSNLERTPGIEKVVSLDKALEKARRFLCSATRGATPLR